MRNQLDRAALSVSKNIAEGFERGTKRELIAFLHIARGSAGEVRSMLALIDRLPDAGPAGGETDPLREQVTSISRQLGRWIESIKATRSPGHSSPEHRARRLAQAKERGEAFLRKLEQIRSHAKPTHPAPPRPEPQALRDPA